MTFEKLALLIERYNIPHDVEILSDSGWECNATNMDGIYYPKKKKQLYSLREQEEKNILSLNGSLFGQI